MFVSENVMDPNEMEDPNFYVQESPDESSSSDSGISYVSEEDEEWSYSLFTDVLLTLHLTAAGVFLVYSVKKLLAEMYSPTVASIGSFAEMLTELPKLSQAAYALCLRPEVFVSLLVMLATIYIGKEVGNFRVLRIFGGHVAYVLSRLVFYIFIFLHYYYIRVFVENV